MYLVETPEAYEKTARDLFLQGYNCSQSVVAAFCDVLKMDRKQAVRMASAFGGGMGRMREVCGCVSGMFMILGYLYGYDDPTVYECKKELYAKVQELADGFKKTNGSIICKEILGIDGEGKDNSYIPSKRTKEYYEKRPCPQLAGFAAKILAEFIREHPI